MAVKKTTEAEEPKPQPKPEQPQGQSHDPYVPAGGGAVDLGLAEPQGSEDAENPK